MRQERTRRGRVLALGLVAIAAAGGLAACGHKTSGSGTSGAAGSGSSQSAGSPFDVVIDTGTTGPYAANGQSAVIGLKAAANVLNATQGGIDGHRVKVEVLNNQGNPTTAAQILEQRLAQGPKPDMIEPGGISSEGVIEVPIAAAAKILSIGTPNDSSLNNPSKYPYEFLMAPDAEISQDSLMSYFKAHGYKSAAMLYSTDAYGASTGAAAIAAAKKAGVTLHTATYSDTDLNVTSELQKLQSAHPQVLYVQGFGAPAGVILSDRYSLGWKIPVVGDLTLASTPLVSADAAKPDEKGLLVQELKLAVYSRSESPAVKNYITAVKKFGPISGPLPITSYQYDSLMLAAQAAKQAGSVSTPAMASALENLKQPATPPWVTLSQFRFSAKDHSPAASPSNWIVAPASKLTDGQFDAP